MSASFKQFVNDFSEKFVAFAMPSDSMTDKQNRQRAQRLFGMGLAFVGVCFWMWYQIHGRFVYQNDVDQAKILEKTISCAEFSQKTRILHLCVDQDTWNKSDEQAQRLWMSAHAQRAAGVQEILVTADKTSTVLYDVR